jgi:hypothetical protein
VNAPRLRLTGSSDPKRSHADGQKTNDEEVKEEAEEKEPEIKTEQ